MGGPISLQSLGLSPTTVWRLGLHYKTHELGHSKITWYVYSKSHFTKIYIFWSSETRQYFEKQHDYSLYALPECQHWPPTRLPCIAPWNRWPQFVVIPGPLLRVKKLLFKILWDNSYKQDYSEQTRTWGLPPSLHFIKNRVLRDDVPCTKPRDCCAASHAVFHLSGLEGIL